MPRSMTTWQSLPPGCMGRVATAASVEIAHERRSEQLMMVVAL